MTPSAFVLDNATIWVGDGTQINGHLVVQGGHIEDVAAGPYSGELPAEDLGGASLSPGMIDLMVLGGFGRSILQDDPAEIAQEYLKLGVTACQFCTGTMPWDAMRRIGENIRVARDKQPADAAEIIGFYPEGPFQHPERTGASLAENALPPTEENVRMLLDEIGDVVTLINVSPGTEGDVEAVRTFSLAGKVVSMAHSNAPADRVNECLEAGTTVLGHVWDNNSGLIGDSGVQQPTIEHVALTDERVGAIHLICDGVHVHPVMIKLVLRARGVEAICLVTDAVQRAGCEDGSYQWDDGRTFIKKGGVGRTSEGGLCGSALLLPDMLRNFVKFTGVAPAEAIRTVTLNPAASLGLENRMGLLAPGRQADLVLWDEKLRVQRVWRGGVEAEINSDIAEVVLA